MMNVLFVPLNAVKLFIHNHNLCRDNIRGIPECLAQAVELSFSIGDIGDSFCMDEKVPFLIRTFNYTEILILPRNI